MSNNNLFMNQMLHIEQSNTLNGVDVPSTDDMMVLNIIIMLDSINSILNKNVWNEYIENINGRTLYANREGVEIMLKSIPDFVTLLSDKQVTALQRFVSNKKLSVEQLDAVNKINACALVCYIREYGINAAKDFYILPQFTDEEIECIGKYKELSLLNNNNNKILDVKFDLKELEKFTDPEYLNRQILLIQGIISDLNSKLEKLNKELKTKKSKLKEYSKVSTNHLQKMRRQYKDDTELIDSLKQNISEKKESARKEIHDIEKNIENIKTRLSNERYYLGRLNGYKNGDQLTKKIKSLKSKLNRLEHYDPTVEVNETKDYYRQVFEYLKYVFQID